MGRGSVVKVAVGVAGLLMGLGAGTTSAFGESVSNGQVQVWVTLGPNGNGGKAVFTGAIGDYGAAVSTNSSGKPTKNGDYEKLTLKKGSILVNSTAFNAAGNNAQPSTNNTTTCSFAFDYSGSVQIVSGTGTYSGITGTLNLTAQFAAVGPRTKSGSCNQSNNANPLAFFATVTGSGSVSY
jgi:hypothetical protein